MQLNKLLNNNIFLAVIMILAIYLMNFHQMEGAMWTGPYLSVAHNFNLSNIRLNWDEIEHFAHLPKEEMFNYNFHYEDSQISNNYAYFSFAFIIFLVTKIFFFLGDLEAIIISQAIIHIIISLLIINKLKYNYEKLIFFLLYAINPVILYFVNFPFYYFWQCIVSAIFVYYYITKKRFNNYIFLITIIFVIIFLARPTVLFLILFFYIIYGYRENWKKALVSIILFFCIISIAPKSDKNTGVPWHTVFEGLGAYANTYSIEIYDAYAYKFFTKNTGKTFNNYKVEDAKTYSEYIDTLKKGYLKILREDPILIIRNAILNILSSYSFGYKTGNDILINISIILGLIMVILLLYTKQYILFVAIGLTNISFTPYFPPIAAYMFGGYILLVLGFIGIIRFFLNKYTKGAE